MERDEREAQEEEEDLSDPSHRDHDLSEWGRSYIDAPSKPWFLRRWLLLLVALVVIGSLLLPYVARLSVAP